MKHIILLIVVLFNLPMYGQQEITVISFEQKVADISARTNRRDDIKGLPCALIKVQFPIQDAIFLGDIVGTTPFKTNEYWVYMPQHSTQLEIRTPRTKPLVIDFKQDTNVSIESNNTYELCLITKPKDAPELYKEAMIDLSHNQTADALGKLATLADEGYAPALFQLGYNMLVPYTGLEDPNSKEAYQEVYSLYKKAAEKGFPDAQYELAEFLLRHIHYDERFYHSSIGQVDVDKHDTDSLYIWSLIKNAANSGIVPAQQLMAQDPKWCEENAAKGNAVAEFAMGLRYDDSLDWDAVNGGIPDTFNHIGDLIEKIKSDNREKNIQKAVEWYMKAANQKSEEALFRLSALYRQGHGVEKNIEKALSLQTEAAKQGNHLLQFHMALEYHKGYVFDSYDDIGPHGGVVAIDVDLNKTSYWLEKMFNHKAEDLQYFDKSYCREMIEAIYDNGLDEQAFSLCLRLDELGFDFCQIMLGKMYYEGIGTKQDYEKSLAIFRKIISENDDIEDSDLQTACIYMGLAYKYGNGVAQDIDKFIDLLQKVVRPDNDFCNSQACYELGMLYKEKGDYAKSIMIFGQKGSLGGTVGGREPIERSYRENNYYNALCDLQQGLLKYQGLGGEKDEDRGVLLIESALEDLLRSAAAGYQPSINYLEEVEYDEIVQKIRTQMEAEEDYKNGQNYEYKKDYVEAAKYYISAAEKGYDKAQNKIGTMYYNGKGVPQDYSEAVKWYRKAAEQGYSTAQDYLGFMYSNGRGVQRDYSEAVRWYRKAAEQGDASGQCGLGYMYQYGKGVTQDYSEAVKWYRKAAEQNDTIAQYNLGLCYQYGRGVSIDLTQAKYWYEKAAAQGNEDAKKRLLQMGY